jgi:hypothetical protein
MSAFFTNARRRGQQKAKEQGSLKMEKRRKIKKFLNNTHSTELTTFEKEGPLR